jgi:outer membrane lipoprotein-sorting protein
MAKPDEFDLTRLSRLDPALREDGPPAPGSLRYDALLERAMTVSPPRARVSRRSLILTAAAAVVLAGAATATVLGTHSESASAAVTTAATHIGRVTSLRATVSATSSDGSRDTSNAEVSGDRFRLVSKDDLGTDTLIVIGEYGWETRTDQDGTHSDGKQKLPANARLAPFARSTEHVIRAALQDASVKKEGTDEIRGTEATHYHLELTDASRTALKALPDTELAWFELDSVDKSATIDVWIADDLIQRITVRLPDRLSTTDFYDFNAPITVTAPAR